MNDRSARRLVFTAVVEFGTALLLLADPALVVNLLLGAPADATVRVVSRCFGVALLALAVACWPGLGTGASASGPAMRAMLVYNALIALFLAYLGALRHVGGPLLWPAVALHAVVAVLLVTAARGQRPTQATDA